MAIVQTYKGTQRSMARSNTEDGWPDRPSTFPELMTPEEAAMFLRLDQIGHTPASACRIRQWPGRQTAPANPGPQNRDRQRGETHAGSRRHTTEFLDRTDAALAPPLGYPFIDNVLPVPSPCLFLLL